jgi:hypothetical protein
MSSRNDLSRFHQISLINCDLSLSHHSLLLLLHWHESWHLRHNVWHLHRHRHTSWHLTGKGAWHAGKRTSWLLKHLRRVAVILSWHHTRIIMRSGVIEFSLNSSVIVVLSLLHHHSWLDQSYQLVQNCEYLRFVHDVCDVGILLLVVVEVLFVMHLLILLLPYFLNLIVVDI